MLNDSRKNRPRLDRVFSTPFDSNQIYPEDPVKGERDRRVFNVFICVVLNMQCLHYRALTLGLMRAMLKSFKITSKSYVASAHIRISWLYFSENNLEKASHKNKFRQ